MPIGPMRQAVIAAISLSRYKRPSAIMIARNRPTGTSTVRYCIADSPMTLIAASFGSFPFATSPSTRAN